MKKRNKRIIGVAIFLLAFSLLGILFIKDDKVEAADKKNEINCETGSISASDYFDVRIAQNPEDPSIVYVGSENGAFKVKEVLENKERILTPESTYLNTVFGKEAPNNGDRLELKINSDGANSSDKIMLRLELVTDSKYGCNNKGYVFDYGFTLANYSSNNSYDNPHYDTYCTFLRTGQDTQGKFSEIKNRWNQTAANNGSYSNSASYCYNKKVSNVYSDNTVITMIKLAVNDYYYSTITNSSSSNEDSSFITKFNESKALADKQYHSATVASSIPGSLIGTGRWTTGEYPDYLRCDANYTGTGYKEDGSYDYSNRQAFYTKGEDEEIKYTVTINRTGSRGSDSNSSRATNIEETRQEEKEICKKTCEEVVDVEYGPPIASKAGLCFEYRVKLTSRVKCTTRLNTSAAPTPPSVCTPYPFCNNGTIRYMHQGGPTEEFENCINSCDGGKYSQSCSNKCYKKVYGGNQNNVLNTGANDFVTPTQIAWTAQQFYACPNGVTNPEGITTLATGGFYTRSSAAGINWVSTSSQYGHPSYGRYYIERELGDTCSDHGTRVTSYNVSSVFGNGIKRENYGDNRSADGYCNDACSWMGCANADYLNNEDAEADYQKQLIDYDAAIKKCAAQASCTEKTATFTMSTSYTDDKGDKKTIEYPLTKSGGDKLASKNKEGMPNEPKGSEDTVILDYAGCYSENSANDWYQTELTYPGTWVNNKLGEISYEPKNEDGWYLEKNRFCLPLNAQNVNVKWWNWYMKQVSQGTYFESNDYTQYCSEIDKVSDGAQAPAPDEWNIVAIAQHFGYYGWNFKVECFYALNDDPSDNSASASDKKLCETKPTNYRVRTVDNDNLFPSEDGTGSISSITGTGRAAGFNWTDAATIVQTKGLANYYIIPSEYISRVQARGNSIYQENDKYLDYSFHLTPANLREIRSYNKDMKSYTNFGGTTEEVSGITVYKSNLFRPIGSASRSGIISSSILGNVGCNNDGNGLECETSIVGN